MDWLCKRKHASSGLLSCVSHDNAPRHKDIKQRQSLTLVIDFGTVLSTEALVLQSLIVHIKLLNHVVVELVPAPTGIPTVRQTGSKDKEDFEIYKQEHSQIYASDKN